MKSPFQQDKELGSHSSFLDTFLIHISLSVFEVDRRQHPISRMFAFRVIEHFDVIEEALSGVIPCLVSTATYAFAFEQIEVAICNGIVMAVSAQAHRMFEVVGAQESGPADGAARVEVDDHCEIKDPIVGLNLGDREESVYNTRGYSLFVKLRGAVHLHFKKRRGICRLKDRF